jgi:hypothetical protein
MVGERGGSTVTAEQGFALVEQHKPVLSNAIRFDILDWLESHSTWHRNDLRVDVPPESKNAVGAVVNGLIRSGRIVETGERRKSSDPASHARKSNVYRLMVGAGSSEVEEASVAVSSGPGPAAGDIADSPEVSEVSAVTRVPSKNEVQNLGNQGKGGSGVSAPEPARLFEMPDRSLHGDAA